MVRVIWSDAAKMDLTEIMEYTSGKSSMYAENEIQKIVECAAGLMHFPLSGKTVSLKHVPPVRQLLSGNYKIFYRYVAEIPQVAIVRIIHGASGLNPTNLVFEPDGPLYRFGHRDESDIEKGIRSLHEDKTHSHEEIQELAARWLRSNPQKG